MFKSFGANAALAGVVFAVVGFSIALATSNRGTEPTPFTAPRTVSSNLNFANALLPNGVRDLGDAVVGSACFVRTIGVTGGLPPFTYSITSNANGLAANKLTLVQRPLVGLFGTTAGAVIPLTATPGPLTFGVSVFDSVLSSNSNAFTINILSGQNQFRFALTQLNDGQRFRDYECALPVINGAPPYNFAVVPGTITAGGKAQSSLTAIGLNLTPDGMVIGQPLVSGTVTFTAACTDAGGNFAKSRNGTTTNQIVTLNVLANVLVTNTVVVTQFNANGDTSVGGKDKVTLTAQLNLNGKPLSSLPGPITFRMGNALVVSGTGSKGKFDLTDARAAAAKTPKVKASINKNGLLKATFSNQSFGTRSSFGPIGTSTVIPIQISVGDAVDGMTVVSASTKTQKGTKFNMKYKLGTVPKGGVSGTLAGAFIVTAVTGKDDTKGGTGDSWKVSFLSVPPSGSSFANAGSSATVKIGKSFSDTTTITANKNSIKSVKVNAKTPNKISTLTMSDKGKGSYQTGPLDAALTGINQASKSTTSTVYATEIDLGTLFGGAGSGIIFPKKNQWTSKNPSK
jgi:hypothetical protein